MVLWCLWWWVGDGLVLCRWCFFCFGDGVLIVWWWTLMNILIGILSKIQNSNLNLYIVHLWANQCSCGSYVVGWCFKCFDMLVTSRACFGEILVMCVHGAVMCMMMSGWWLGVVSLRLQCCFFLWWWCFDCLVMNIDEHFDRVSKQNLKFLLMGSQNRRCPRAQATIVVVGGS